VSRGRRRSRKANGASSNALSAEDLARLLESSSQLREPRRVVDQDWLWLGLTVLWERWCPDLPNFERLDDLIQEGYRLLGRDPAAACNRWLEAWGDVQAQK